ncbi:MAG: hypothetical protein FJW56_04295 [Actinobacteria bacterium]|nr:hypothetical protein [Actinomycetota bacterium]
MGREIRRVPANWEHPKRINPCNNKKEFRPMYQRGFKEAYADFEKELKRWYQEYEAFENGKIFNYKDKIYSKQNGNTYEDWAGEPPLQPNPYDYMSIGDWYQLFEDVSEGTPLSPPFKTKEELIEWLIHNDDYWGNRWTRKQAEGIIKAGSTPSGLLVNGRSYWGKEVAGYYNEKDKEIK